MGAEGRGLCSAAGTGRGGGASPALRAAACSTAVSNGAPRRAGVSRPSVPPTPLSSGDGEGVEGALPCRGLPLPRLAGAGERRARCPPGTVPCFSLPRFWRRPRGLPARVQVFGEQRCRRPGREGAPPGASPAEGSTPGGGEESGAPAGARHCGQGVPAAPPSCPLPGPAAPPLPGAARGAPVAKRASLRESSVFAVRSVRGCGSLGFAHGWLLSGWGSTPATKCRGHRARGFLFSQTAWCDLWETYLKAV